MNKSQLIDSMADIADIPKATAHKALDAMIQSIQNALVDNDQVPLVGFGTFYVKVRAARIGRNPKTGEAIQISETLVPAFKPGKFLKEAVSNGVVEHESVEEEAEA